MWCFQMFKLNRSSNMLCICSICDRQICVRAMHCKAEGDQAELFLSLATCHPTPTLVSWHVSIHVTTGSSDCAMLKVKPKCCSAWLLFTENWPGISSNTKPTCSIRIMKRSACLEGLERCLNRFLKSHIAESEELWNYKSLCRCTILGPSA